MADDRRVTIGLRKLHGIECFGKRTDLIHLHQNGICRSRIDPLFQELHIRYEQIITYKLNFAAELLSQDLPILPIAFSAAVFNAHDWIFAAQLDVEIDQLCATELFACALLEGVRTVAVI